MSMLRDFQALFAMSKNIIAGAGLSAASGIPTFLGPGGLWRKYDAMALATPQAFICKKPELSLAIAPLPSSCRSPMLLTKQLPTFVLLRQRAGATFKLITQNVDGLSIRALPPDAREAAKPIEMHSSVFRVKCTRCDYSAYDYNTPICPSLAGTETVFERRKPEHVVKVEDLPSCPRCRGLLRPGVVWFGESIEAMPEIEDFVFLGPCEETLLEALGLKRNDRGELHAL